MVVIQDVYEANYSCYGVRKMWKAINRDYADQFGPVARCTLERLMRQWCTSSGGCERDLR